jgi:TPP-dependent 2-oxoacid decarboxylase
MEQVCLSEMTSHAEADSLVSLPGVADAVHASDLVLNLGPLLSDSNTGGFTRDIKDSNLVSLGHAFCQVKEKKYDGIHFLPVLRKLVAELSKDPKSYGLPRPQKEKIQVSTSLFHHADKLTNLASTSIRFNLRHHHPSLHLATPRPFP